MKRNDMHFHVNAILTEPEYEWDLIRCNAMGNSRVAYRALDVDWHKYNTKDYLFTHDTACCSVETEKNGYWITPPCWELVNANGNAWTTPVLLASFKTFIGGDNFLEHCFVKGTRVLMADGEYRRIEEIKPGEHVINRLGKADMVLNTQIRKSSDLYEISSNAILSGKLVVTGNHPFYAFRHEHEGEPLQPEWITAAELADGNEYSLAGRISRPESVDTTIYSEDGCSWKLCKYTIRKLESEDELNVYNIEVQNDNSYIAEGIVVHNCQIPALSKGKILDAIARPVVHHSEKYGDANVYYVDVLVATNRKHTNLIDQIESGRLNTLSMGCGKAGCPITMADGSIKEIQNVQVGDIVITHKGNHKKVSKTFQFDVIDTPVYKLHYGYGALELTGEHPVFIERDGNEPGFVPISELKAGDTLFNITPDGNTNKYPIQTIEKTYFTGKVYNFSVLDDNSYVANGIAVHNCLAEVTQCSICGKRIYDGDKNCEHIDRYLGQMVTCSDGKERKCAEFCGACNDEGDYIDKSNSFIEISWVSNPAFQGSVINAFVETNEERTLREKSRYELEHLFDDNLFERLKVADMNTKIALNITRDIVRGDRIAEKIVKKLK